MMTEDHRSVKQFHERQNSLTPGDIEIITGIMQSMQYNWEHNVPGAAPHVCRFSDDITPDDLRDMVETHKKLAEMVSDSKNVIRRTILGILVVVFMGLLTKGFWATLWDKIK